MKTNTKQMTFYHCLFGGYGFVLFTILPLSDGKFRSNFTLGGLNHFKNFTDATKIESEKINKNREGYYGWVGIGG